MSSIVGTWDVTIDGLKGLRTDVYTFTDLSGRIACQVESVAADDTVTETTLHGDELELQINETAPIPAWFTLRGRIEGDRLTGEVKSKYLPAQAVLGIRRT